MSSQTDPSVPTLNCFEITDLDEAVAHAAPAWDALRGASIFLTGGTGFVGQWLLSVIARANEIHKLGLTVTVLTRSIAGFSARCPQLVADPAIHLVEGDVRLFEFPKGPFTHIIHAATDTSLEADQRPLQLLETIVGGTRRILEFALTARVDRVLFLSSGAVYGYGDQPASLDGIPEDFPGACSTTERRSVYGQAKRLAEQLVTIFHVEHGLKTVIARLFALVGPGMPLNTHFAIGNFIRDAILGRPIIVSGNGTPVRSYLYAGDLAAWLLRLLIGGRSGDVYNVGSDQVYTLADLAAHVAAVVPGAHGYLIKGGSRPNAFRSRYVPAIDRARSELGLDVWTSLTESIRRTGRWATVWSHEPRVSSAYSTELPTSTKKLGFVVDLDGVVASLTPNNDYSLATPLQHNISYINRLYDAGHRITLFTARGSTTGRDWHTLTRQQLTAWGVRYHELRFGKPAADYYIDDRMLSPGELASLVDRIAPLNSAAGIVSPRRDA